MPVNANAPILIVDDYQTMLRIMHNLLKQLGFSNIEEANDGSSALEKLKTGSYELIVSDWNMESMTGLDLLKEVRSDRDLKHIPYIMIAAENKNENMIAAKEAGVTNYIVTPFNALTLKSKLQSVFGDF